MFGFRSASFSLISLRFTSQYKLIRSKLWYKVVQMCTINTQTDIMHSHRKGLPHFDILITAC
jgi:hypothetical protein